VIVDVIDTHSMYQSQWKKRSAYYKKCAYQIERWNIGAERGVTFANPVAVPVERKGGECLIED